MITSSGMRGLVWYVALAIGACAKSYPPVKAPEPLEFYVTVDPAATALDDDTVDASSFIAPPQYLDRCAATPTPVAPRQRNARLRAREIALATLRWPRELCQCLLDARGPSPYVRGPDGLSFALEARASDRPRMPDQLLLEGESPYHPCLRDYLEDRPVSAGPGPVTLHFKIELHESYELRRVHDVLRSVRLDFVDCYQGATPPLAPIDVKWVIDDEGRATDIQVPPRSKPGACVESILSRLTFSTCMGCLARYEVLPP